MVFFHRLDVGGQACFPSEGLYRQEVYENQVSGKLDEQSENIQ